MILQYLNKVQKDNSKTEVIETIRDNVTGVSESDTEIEVTFSRPNGEIDLVTFIKENETISNMWLLNDNFKTLKRLI